MYVHYSCEGQRSGSQCCLSRSYDPVTHTVKKKQYQKAPCVFTYVVFVNDNKEKKCEKSWCRIVLATVIMFISSSDAGTLFVVLHSVFPATKTKVKCYFKIYSNDFFREWGKMVKWYSSGLRHAYTFISSEILA